MKLSRQIITSASNPKVKFARAVREGLEKDCVFVEGLRLAEEVLKSRLEVVNVFLTEKLATSERIKSFLFELENRRLVIVSEKVMNLIADTETPQGIVVICKRPESGKELIENRISQKIKSKVTPLVLMLNRINNPSNLGAVLRTAEAVDVEGVILTKGSADAFSPKAIRGSMGACLRLPIWERVDFFEAVAWAKKNGLRVSCADVKATKSYTQIDWKVPRLIVFGSEAEGMSKEELEEIQEIFKIPMRNNVQSLNVAVACGIILYEAIKYCCDSSAAD
ncbi:MAG: RNA methyltransferase [Acidobacteria bacterium]|jgi:TrmH family RNA methyltransferase|nr:MAG: RNA methyltransferase [Acidobacteriota bacterium]GIU80978.1 MAG: RNA methyltransferase [Pyrinomonadaceae bacterium]